MTQNYDKLPFKAYMTLQYKELAEHKEFLIMKDNNPNITDEYTLEHWIFSGNAERFQKDYLDHIEDIGKVCNVLCNTRENCEGVKSCPLTNDLVHRLMHDGKYSKSK